MLPTIGNRLGSGDLPAGYIPLEYLENTGSQWIDTAIRLDNNSIVDCTFSVASDSWTYQMPYGIDYARRFGFYTRYSGCYFAFAFGQLVEEPQVRIPVEIDKIYNVRKEGRKNYIDDELVLENTTATFKSENNCLLFLPVVDDHIGVGFGNPNINCRFLGKIYKFSISSPEKLLLNFIPCLNDKGVPCMFDTVSKTPFYNKGEGEFSYA